MRGYGTPMTKTQYLYGTAVDTSKWNTTYVDVLHLKIALANERIRVLNQVHYMERDSVNITECLRAIKFNENLLGEL
jgi:hypothetical protein